MVLIRGLGSIAVAALAAFTGLCQAEQETSSAIEARGKFPFFSDKVRGVNLGGWFVLEPWITPSLFEEFADSEAAVDEFTFTRTLGKDEALNRLEKHWKSWIKKEDFHDMASKGLNLVRIPIGYWSVKPRPNDPYVQGAYKHVHNAVKWAHEAGLKVMLDLHGASRSQNGFDNSGRRGPIHWQKSGSIRHTRKVLNKMRDDFANHPAVVSIEVLNEPYGPSLNVGKIKQFYRHMNNNFKGHEVATTIHDAFMGVNSWNDFGNNQDNWVLDTHHYEVFTMENLALDLGGHIGTACSFGGQMSTNNKYTIAGEWTAAMTDCAKWLNGIGYGARYEGAYTKGDQTSYYIGDCGASYKGTLNDFSADQKNAMRQYIEAQLDGFEFAGGWVFWTWRTESAPEWDFQTLANNGIFPQPLSDRQYPGQCG